MDATVDAITRSGYGLTMGLHSRIGAARTAPSCAAAQGVGNLPMSTVR